MIRYIELFGGICACTKALQNAQIPHTLVDYVEIDKWAVKSTNAIYGLNFKPQDIREWDKDVEVDLIMHGSPCQDFSPCGKQAGGDEDSGTRSSLMFETIRIIEKLKPKYIIWENVPNVLIRKHRHNFLKYISYLDELGYSNHVEVLNAKNFGIPQNRERLFVVSIRKDLKQEFEFPCRSSHEDKTFLQMINYVTDEKYYLSEKMKRYIVADNSKWSGNNKKSLINKTIASTINTGEGSRRCDASNYICYSLAQNYDLKKSIDNLEDYKIRRLIPLECFRYMGFDDVDCEKASKVCSDTQLYKQAGNSIVVPVLEEILKELIK